MKSKVICMMLTAGLSGSLLAMPSVSDVTIAQDSATRRVTVTYKMAAGDPGIVTLDICTNGLSSPVSIGSDNIHHVSGDVNKLIPGDGETHTIYWQPDKSWPGHKITDGSVCARVNAYAANRPPAYMAVDLTGNAAIAYYESAGAVPGGVSNDIYKTEILLMRKITAPDGTFEMGYEASGDNAAHPASIASDYFIGVYQITQSQWKRVFGADDFKFKNDNYLTRPADNVSYNIARQSSTHSPQGDAYPAAPYGDSFLGKLRTATGLAFDLPSEAQWEYACRAGHPGTLLGDGSAYSTPNMTKLGRINANSISVSESQFTTVDPNDGGPALVGSYAPNSWGIYDMHGNVFEWCLDWYEPDITKLNGAVVATRGANTRAERVRRGGSYKNDAAIARSWYRLSAGTTAAAENHGIRVCIPDAANINVQ